MIITFPGHKLLRCNKGEECADSCMICGGLSLCTVCGGAEGSLPTDCPGERMPEIVEADVMLGNIDYRLHLGWVQESNKTRAYSKRTK